jgi:hypothetical protein
MAATVASYTGDRLVTTLSPYRPETWPPRKTGQDDEREWLCASMEALAGLWRDFKNGKSRTFDTRSRAMQSYRAGLGGPSVKHTRQDVNQQTRAVQLLDLFSRPPPSYEDSLTDVPPDYTGTDAAAAVNSLVDVKLDLGFPDAAATSRDSQRRSDAKLDFNQPHGIRYHAKKAKKAAKTAQKEKWADDDGEKKEEPPADDGAGGGDAGGGDAGGDAGGGGDGGGDPPGGDGGDEPDDIWGAAGGSKKKKKKKTNAW